LEVDKEEWERRRKKEKNKCWQPYGEKETFVYFWWKCKMMEFLEKTIGLILKK
jgi:hypothetical protein